jgi:eukaryotic-like serine/threonine-protein kinase
MTRQVIARDKLGALTKIGQGGQGVVYRAPNARTKFADSMVYKEYKSQARAEIDFTALAAMPALVEDSLSYAEAERLVSVAAWPCALVEDGGAPTGFVMPAIPTEFFIELTTARGVSSSIAEFQHLLNHSSVLEARGIDIDEADRYSLLREVASGLAFLHKHGVCVGDISPKNLLFTLRPHPAVFFVDCDAVRINGVSALPQMETPGWNVPSGQELATIYSDTYKLGLLALRLLAGDQDTKNPQHLPVTTPSLLRQLITDTVNNDSERRPLPEAWTYVLGHAIEQAQHHKKTAAAISVPLEPPPVPVVHSRPSGPTARSGPPVAVAHSGPMAIPPPPPTMRAAPPAKTNMWPIAILGAAVVIAVVVAVVLVAALHHTDNSTTNAQTSPSTLSTYPAGAWAPTSTSAPPVDPEAAAYQRLLELKNGDASALAQVAERWIPQLSSKHATQPWTQDPEDGMSYDSELTLQEHQRLRQQFGAILAWSGDWTVWVAPDYWITVVPQAFPDAEGVLSWCNSNHLDRDHCSAQIVSKTQGPNRTHAYNR